MYIAEAIPTVVMGVISFFLLTDRPEQAKFLTAEERNWLVKLTSAKIGHRKYAKQAFAVGLQSTTPTSLEASVSISARVPASHVRPTA